MIFCKIFQLFIILACVSATSFVIASDSEDKNSSRRSSQASTTVLSTYVHIQPVNTTDKVNGSMKRLELSDDITSLYIKDEGSVKSKAPLLNAADQIWLASILKKSAVNELTFRDCDEFGFEQVLQDVLAQRGISVNWELILEEDGAVGED